MSSIFENCKSLTSIDLSGFETINVEKMEKMFRKCESLEELIYQTLLPHN